MKRPATPLHFVRTTLRAAVVAATALLQACMSILHAPDGATYTSADRARTALVQNGRVVVDGRPESPQFDGIANVGVKFSRDGRRVAYVGMRGTQRYLVVDGREFGPFESVSMAGVSISPAGRHVALPLVNGGRWHLWLNGELTRPFDGIAIGHPVFSDDESRFAYAGKDGTSWSVVADDTESARGQDLLDDGVGFTSTSVLYAAYKTTEGWQVRLGDKTSEIFDAINKPGIILGSTRRSIAFIARRGQQVFVCVDLQCGPPHLAIGTRVLVDSSIFGDNFWKGLGLSVGLGVVAGLAGVTAPTMLVSGGGSATYTTVGSVVFSPDDRHHAYVAGDPLDTVVIDAGAARVELPPGKSVEWISFDNTSQVLMYRTSDDTEGLRVLPVPGAPKHDEGAATVTLNLKLPEGGALVFVDGRFAGVSPPTLRVNPGARTLRVQAPGRQSRQFEVNAVAGQDLTVDLDVPVEPVRAAVQAAFVGFDDPKLPLASKVKRDHVWRGRVMAGVPHSEEVIGVALYGAGADAVVFAEKAIYVRNSFSSRASFPRSYVVSYEEFARRPIETDHRAFEVTLTPEVVVKTAGMSLSKERLIEFLQTLRTKLAAAYAAPAAARAP